jgi:hypothetical protein
MYRVIPKNSEIQEKPVFGIKKRIGKAVFRPLTSAAKGRKGRFSSISTPNFTQGPRS